MTDPKDITLGKLAVERKFCTTAQIRECLGIQEKMHEMGIKHRLGEILVEKGYVSRAQLSDILTAQGQPLSRRIAGYEILSKIGQGGMGAVYKARQISLARPVALKILSPHLAKDKDFVARFIREARAAGKLNHENIVQAIDAGESDGLYYFAMEFVDGESLAQILMRERCVEEKRALEIVLHVLNGLEHAAKHGIVHRDIKPDNILITNEGLAKVADLGLAKEITSGGGLTQTGTTVGTPYYISPEQARGEATVDTRSDIYSLGATLYHMVVGKVPFEGASPVVIMTKHLTERLPSPKILNPAISDGICQIIERMMAKDLPDRYQTPTDLIADIKRQMDGLPLLTHRLDAGRSSVMSVSESIKPPQEPPTTKGGWRQFASSMRVRIGAATVAIVLFLLFALPKPTPAPEPISTGPANPPAQPDTSGTSPLPGIGAGIEPAIPSTPESDGDLAAAEEYALQHPHQFDAAISLFLNVAERFKGTAAAVSANSRVQELRIERERLATEEFQKRKKEADALIEEDRFGRAYQVVAEFPAELRRADVYTSVQALAKNISDLAEARAKKYARTARESAEQGRFDDAMNMVERLNRFEIPEATTLAQTLASEIQTVRNAKETERKQADREEAKAIFKELLKKCKDDVRAFQLDAAEQKCEEHAHSPNAFLERMVEELQHDILLVRSATVKALDNTRNLTADFYTFEMRNGQKTRVRILGANEGVLSVELAHIKDSRMQITYDMLSPSQIRALVAHLPRDNPDYIVAHGIILMAFDELDSAKAQFEFATSLGADVDRFLNLIRTSQEGEVEAESVFWKANSEIMRENWEKALEVLKSIPELYGDTRFVADHKGEIGDMMRYCKEGLASTMQIFSGECSLSSEHKYEFRYDFTNPAQLKDWVVLPPLPPIPPRKWEIKRGILVGSDDESLSLKSPFVGDIHAQFEVLARKQLESAFTVHLFNDGSGHGYAFRIRKKRAWIARLDGSRKETLLVSGEIEVTPDPVTVHVTRIGRSLAFALGEEFSLATEDATFDSGYFTIDPGDGLVQIDNLELSASIDPSWRKEEMVRREKEVHVEREWDVLFNGADIDKWSQVSGKWDVKNEYIIGKAAPTPEGKKEEPFFILHTGTPKWRNYSFRATCMLKSGDGVGIAVRFLTDETKGYLAGFNLDGARTLYRLDPQAIFFSDKELVAPDMWHTIQLTAINDEITLEIDGHVITRIFDESAKSGYVALWFSGEDSFAVFKDVKIRMLK